MKKLYLSDTDKKIGGVCGGIAEFLEVDSTIIRLIFAFSVCFGGVGLLAYLLAWLIIPPKPKNINDK